jgi:16S rRNA (cytosine967-C5)-methyltransferase
MVAWSFPGTILTARLEATRTARDRAYEILRRVEESGAYAAPLLDIHEARLGDSREAGLLHEIVLGVLRWQALLDHAVGQVASRPPEAMDPAVRRVLRMAAYALLFLDRVPDFAAVDTAVDLIRRVAPPSRASFVNGVLRALVRVGPEALPPDPEPGDVRGLAVAHSHPEWWVRRRVELAGWVGTLALLRANNRPAPVVLRPDLKRTTPRELQARFEAEGVRTESCAVVREALRVVEGPFRHTRTFREGYAWAQDEASPLVPSLFGTVLRPRVADLCAAPGIKTLQLREALPVGGTIVAADRHAGRLRRLTANLERVGATGILPLAADMATGRPPLRGPFDHVLVDAPCSGTGTFRRHPEIRWRLAERDLDALSLRQGRILDTAASLLAPGGTLLYAVCSMEPEEGAGPVARFLERHPGLELLDARVRVPDPARRRVGEDGALRTEPADGMDGFFAVLLRRRAS